MQACDIPETDGKLTLRPSVGEYAPEVMQYLAYNDAQIHAFSQESIK